MTDPTLAKIRAVLALDGTAGEAGEVAIHLENREGGPRLFRSATVSVEGAYSVSVSTEHTFFLSLRPDGDLVVHVGPNTGTMARFTVTRLSGFEYALSPRETRYTFSEDRPGVEARLHVTLRW